MANISHVWHVRLNPKKKYGLKVRMKDSAGPFGIPFLSHTHKMLQYRLIEGSLEVRLPTIWTDEKQSRAEAERRERLEERRVEEKESEERRCRCAKR